MNQSSMDLSHINIQKIVFSDMFKAYDYFMKQSLEQPNLWQWAKVDGRVLTYIPA